jgi:hypothetical protein
MSPRTSFPEVAVTATLNIKATRRLMTHLTLKLGRAQKRQPCAAGQSVVPRQRRDPFTEPPTDCLTACVN